MANVAPVIVGTATVYASAVSGATVVLDKPASLQDGDFLVATARTNGTTSPTDFALAGWTRRGYAFIPNDAAGRVFGIYTHPVTTASSEPASYTLAKSVSDARRVGALVIVRGVDLTNPVVGQSASGSSVGTTVTINSYALDSSEPALEVFAWATEIVSPNSATPTAYPGTQIALVPSQSGTASTRTTVWMGSRPVSASTAGNVSLTWVSVSGSAATAVTLRGLSAPSAPPLGFSSVAHMLATPGATWAHRGGSTNWPEMSKYAYEQSVLAGYGALEFSANRTSDGVWVGVHDASLNRTSETTGLADISTMTWAQVQTYQNSLNSGGTPRAYYRLDQFLDDFTPTHVAIVDPKYAIGTYNTEFLNLLDAHGGNSKIVVKFFGVGSGAGSLADAAAARGYQTWGYFYEADVADGDVALWQSRWSILGMNYDASQAAWDEILAYGKPVVGHIAASQANYNTAITRGARMVQSANVAGITAVGASSLFAHGSLTTSGSATQAVSVARASSGSLSMTGSATRSVSITRDASGSLTASGAAERTVTFARTAPCILELAGVASTEGSTNRTADGALAIQGTASVAVMIARTASGSLALGGIGTITLQIIRTAVGILALSGGGVTAGRAIPERLTLSEVAIHHTLTPVTVSHTLEDA